MIQADDIERMSLEEPFKAMELMWASITRAPDAVQSPARHEEVLRSQLDNIARGEGEFLTAAEFQARLKKPHG